MNGRREGIVAVTQTEIMLVLAVVILILLLVKQGQLDKLCGALPDESCAEVLGYSQKTTDRLQPARQVDLDEEVTEELVPGGGAKEDPAPLGPESSSSGAAAAGDGTAKTNAASASGSAQEPGVRQAQGEQTSHQAVSDFATEPRKSAYARQLERENAALRRENLVLRQNAQDATRAGGGATDGTSTHDVRQEIGFLPCWLGDGSPRYYFTYHITYHVGEGLFQIAPHRHLQSGARVVRESLNSEMGAIITSYPQTKISRDEFLRFSRTVLAAQRRFYGSECKLAASINRQVTGDTIHFITRETGFFPIYR